MHKVRAWSFIVLLQLVLSLSFRIISLAEKAFHAIAFIEAILKHAGQ